jgi:hypothetical protein
MVPAAQADQAVLFDRYRGLPQMSAGECIPGPIELPAGSPAPGVGWLSGTLERWPAGAESVSPPGCPGPGHCSTVPADHRHRAGPGNSSEAASVITLSFPYAERARGYIRTRSVVQCQLRVSGRICAEQAGLCPRHCWRTPGGGGHTILCLPTFRYADQVGIHSSSLHSGTNSDIVDGDGRR